MGTLWQGSFLVQPHTSEICFPFPKPQIELQCHFLHLHLFVCDGKRGREETSRRILRKWKHTITFKCYFPISISDLFIFSLHLCFSTSLSFHSLPLCSSPLLASQFYNCDDLASYRKDLLFQFDSSSLSVSLSLAHTPHPIRLLRNTHMLSTTICTVSHWNSLWNSNKQAHTKP